MKLRIKGNTIRIRVTQGEISELEQNGLISDSIQFATQSLTYLIRVGNQTSVQADLDGSTISVLLPEIVASEWTSTDLVSINGSQAIGSEVLKILIEKDYKCLDERLGEDESDLFPNPKNVC